MTAIPSYSTGTVSVGAGDTTIVGSGTIWSGVNVQPGDDIIIGGRMVIVQDVVDVTHLAIDPWPYSDVAAGAAYKIVQRSPLRYAGGQAMASVNKLVAALNTNGVPVIVPPTATEPDPSLGEDQQYAIQPGAYKFWLKTGGVWVFQGVYRGFKPTGAYDDARTYSVGDVASSAGNSYVWINGTPGAGHAPPDATYWDIFAAKGAGATITVGTTTTGAAGSNAAVTNSGTASDAVLNFTVPAGKGYGGTSATSINLAAPGSVANRLLWSEDFTNAVWVNDQGAPTVTANAGVAPDGTTTADLVEDTSTTSVLAKAQAFAIPASSNAYTFSVFVKAGSSPCASLRCLLINGTTPVSAELVINPATGACQWRTGLAGTAFWSESVGNGWWRVYAVVTDNKSGNSTASYTIRPAFASTYNPNVDNAATGSLYVWGAQVTTGNASFGYIKTTSAAASGLSLMTQSGLAYQIGTRVRVASAVAPANYLEILVTQYSGSIMTGSLLKAVGSGTWNAWTISAAGDSGSGDMLSTNNLSDIADIDVARENLKATAHTMTRSTLKAVSTNKVQLVNLMETGREGTFIWRSGDYSTQVTNDPQEGIFVKATAIAASSGVWERIRTPGVYNVKWFGAIGDNSTDDYTAIQAAINLANVFAGGDILFPLGGYKIGTGLVLSTPLVRLIGVGKRYVSITSTATNISLITISAARCGVENLSIFQQVPTTGSVALIKTAAGAVQCTFRDLDLVGGGFCIYASGAFNCLFSDIVARQAWSGSTVYTVNSGALIFENCVFDQDWPVQIPALNGSNDKGARVNSTAYSVGDFVSFSGLLLQCRVAGTSAASAPSISGLWYGSDLADGATLKWRVAGNSSGAAVQVDSGSTYITFRDTDMTGSYQVGARVTNGLGTIAPDVIRFNDVTVGGTFLHGIECDAGRSIWVRGCEVQSCVGSNSFRSALVLQNGLTGEQIVEGNRFTGFSRGVFDGHGFGSVLYTGNTILGMPYAAIDIQANVSDFTITGNNLGGSSIWGANNASVVIQSGTSDWFLIANNRMHGASTPISDNSSGTNKTTSPNR